MKITKVVLILALFLTFGAFSATNSGFFANAAGSDSPDDEVRVETEDEVYEEGQAEPGTEEAQEDLIQPETEVVIGPASDVITSYVFTKYSDDELPSGKIMTCLVSVRNVGTEKSSYLVESLGASLRYPMDFSYYLQNFTRLHINKTVEVNREMTFSYTFRTSEHYTGRPFGFVIDVNYYNEDDQAFLSTVFNKTINFVEIDDPFDAEAVMIYLLGVCVVGLVAVIVYYYTLGSSKKGATKSKRSGRENGVEINGSAHNEWLPAHAIRKSPSIRSAKKSKKDN